MHLAVTIHGFEVDVSCLAEAGSGRNGAVARDFRNQEEESGGKEHSTEIERRLCCSHALLCKELEQQHLVEYKLKKDQDMLMRLGQESRTLVIHLLYLCVYI